MKQQSAHPQKHQQVLPKGKITNEMKEAVLKHSVHHEEDAPDKYPLPDKLPADMTHG